MATRKKRAAPARTRKPRSPARVRKRAKKTRGHHHPELWGLGLLAIGLVLATVVWLGWEGGPVGSRLSDWLDAALGAAAPLVPLVLLVLGSLMLVRSELVDLRPFRTGLAVGIVGLLVALGEDHGGALGDALGGGLARILGGAGVRDPRRRPRARRRVARDRSLRRSRCSAARATPSDGRGPRRAARWTTSSGATGATTRLPLEPVAKVSAAHAPGTAARRRRGVSGRRRADALLRRAPAAARLRARARGHHGRGHRARLRRAYAGDRLPASRPLAPEGEPARTRRRDGRQRPHRRRFSSRRSRTSASRRRSSARSPARASSATSSSSRRGRRSRRSRD